MTLQLASNVRSPFKSLLSCDATPWLLESSVTFQIRTHASSPDALPFMFRAAARNKVKQNKALMCVRVCVCVFPRRPVIHKYSYKHTKHILSSPRHSEKPHFRRFNRRIKAVCEKVVRLKISNFLEVLRDGVVR